MNNERRIAAIGFALAFVVFSFCSPAGAWLRPSFEDAVVVERSELIVVGRLQRGSIIYFPREGKPAEGRSWEHHATLVVKEVLKGDLKHPEMHIVIHYGLYPVVGGYVNRDGLTINLRGGRKDYPKDIIEILDTGGSGKRFGPLVKDATKDNLWFLRKRSGTFGTKPGMGKFGIVDPEDLQPLSLKEYFLAYLSEDPEKAVKAQLKKNPGMAARAKRYLHHLDIQRILKIPDPKARIEKLLPYYKVRTRWGDKPEAAEGIAACGMVAGPYLRKLFDDPKHKNLRPDIIRIWGDVRYEGCVDLLIDLLKQHDKFWAKQELKKGWWNADVGSELTRRRRETYSEVFCSVIALAKIGKPRAKEAIELTKRRWEAIDFSNPQIVEESERALKLLSSRG